MSQNATTDQQSGELARFLHEHPEFTPVFSDDAVLCGFRVGTSCLSLENVQELFYVPREQRPGRRLDRAAHAHVVAESHTSTATPPE